jgi:hypothetical protein
MPARGSRDRRPARVHVQPDQLRIPRRSDPRLHPCAFSSSTLVCMNLAVWAGRPTKLGPAVTKPLP